MNREALAALRALENPRSTVSAWRVADTFRDHSGGRVTLHRTPGEAVMTIDGGVTHFGGVEVRFGPATLRTIARALLGAAEDIEREQAANAAPVTFT